MRVSRAFQAECAQLFKQDSATAYATTVFLLGKNLLVNHEFGFEFHLLLSIIVYTLLYSSLFALLHIGGSLTWGTTCFASVLMLS